MFKKLFNKTKAIFCVHIAKTQEMDKEEHANHFYKVVIEETLRREGTITASSPQEAFTTIWGRYSNGNIYLGRSDFSSVNIYVEDDDQINFYSND